MSQPILIQLKKERDDLTDRQTAIADYMNTPAFAALPAQQQGMAKVQKNLMLAYFECLRSRIQFLEAFPPA